MSAPSHTTTPESSDGESDSSFGVNGSWSQGHTPPRYRALTELTRGVTPVDVFESTAYDAEVNSILDGPRFANGQDPTRCPISHRIQDSFSIADITRELPDFTTDAERDALQSFVTALRRVTHDQRASRGHSVSPLDTEQSFVLTLLSGSVAALTMAMADRRYADQDAIIRAMRQLVDAIERLRDTEEAVRREVAGQYARD